jgi:hypothetical protein
VHFVETFPVDQADGVVAVSESFEFLSFVLEDTPVEVVRHADVKRAAGAALHHVHVVAMFAAHELPNNCHPERSTSSAQRNSVRSRGTLCLRSELCSSVRNESVMHVTFRGGTC